MRQVYGTKATRLTLGGLPVCRVIDAVTIANQRVGETGEIDEPVPVGVVAGKPRHLEAEHEANAGHGCGADCAASCGGSGSDHAYSASIWVRRRLTQIDARHTQARSAADVARARGGTGMGLGEQRPGALVERRGKPHKPSGLPSSPASGCHHS